jgi:hypothetical protein
MILINYLLKKNDMVTFSIVKGNVLKKTFKEICKIKFPVDSYYSFVVDAANIYVYSLSDFGNNKCNSSIFRINKLSHKSDLIYKSTSNETGGDALRNGRIYMYKNLIYFDKGIDAQTGSIVRINVKDLSVRTVLKYKYSDLTDKGLAIDKDHTVYTTHAIYKDYLITLNVPDRISDLRYCLLKVFKVSDNIDIKRPILSIKIPNLCTTSLKTNFRCCDLCNGEFYYLKDNVFGTAEVLSYNFITGKETLKQSYEYYMRAWLLGMTIIDNKVFAYFGRA